MSLKVFQVTWHLNNNKGRRDWEAGQYFSKKRLFYYHCIHFKRHLPIFPH